MRPPKQISDQSTSTDHDVASLETAAVSNADIAMIEWEDAVPLDQKVAARRTTIEALAELDWADKTVAVRVNALDSIHLYRDLIELLESPATHRLDTLLIPKPGVAADVYAVDMFVTQIERAMRRPRPVTFELMIESAQALANLAALSVASPRVEALHLGSVDFASSVGMRVGWGTLASQYQLHGTWGDPWHATMVQIATIAKANGLRAIDGVHISDPSNLDADPEGLIEAAKRAHVLGFDGKWAATPTQCDLITDVFTPTTATIERAAAIVHAADQASDSEPNLNGRALDPATIRDARDTVDLARRLQLATS